jgi:streptogramin lyase
MSMRAAQRAILGGRSIMKIWLSAAALAAAVAASALPAAAWDRGKAEIFAVLPAGSSGPEGLTVAPSGDVFVTTFGFNAQGQVPGPSQLFDFAPNGKLRRQVSIAGSTPHTLGLGFNPVTGDLIVLDFGAGTALKVDPTTGSSTVFATVTGSSGLNALTFDLGGNVYISDSFQGIIWRTGPGGGAATIWAQDPLLTPNGVPPFGANGIEFSNDRKILYVANTANDQIIAISVTNGQSNNPVAGSASVLVNSINGADGIAVDAHDNIWAAANQADEIVVIDKTGKVIAKLGDFNGVDEDGVPQGLLFPASPAFSFAGKTLYVTNLALDLRLAVAPNVQAVDSQWTALVQRYTVSKLRAVIPPLSGSERD